MPDLPTLFLQIGVILALARALGWLFRKIYQPQVVGEMIAGILLGPSLLGWLAPNVYKFLFPIESLGFLDSLSQIGLLLFMFLIGLELDPKVFQGRRRATFLISTVSIAFPFTLGILLAIFLHPIFSAAEVSLFNFALFMGAAMSITAFPVLARILSERKLLRTPLGGMAIACAAINDIAGWGILALVVLVARAEVTSIPLWATIPGVMVFVGAMWFLIRPLVSKLGSVFEAHGSLTQGMLVVILLIVLGSGWITEQLGIHALFGAFLAGVIMPKNIGLIHSLNEKINDVAVVLLLPLFFAFVGLRANLSLVSGGGMWGIASLIIFVAVLGKLGGSMIAARITRMPWREASALGVLMNTRGLMELVLLNIGLDIGLISPELFGMLVLMAIATTFMTSPVLEWVYFARLLPKGYPTPATAANEPWLELGLGDIKEGEVSHKSDESEDIFSVGEI